MRTVPATALYALDRGDMKFGLRMARNLMNASPVVEGRPHGRALVSMRSEFVSQVERRLL